MAMLGSLADTGARSARLAGHPVRRARRRRCRPTATIASATARRRRSPRWSRSAIIAVSAIGIGWRAVDRLLDGEQHRQCRISASPSRWSRSRSTLAPARLSALGDPPHRLGRDPDRPRPLSERPAAQPVGDRRSGARPISRPHRRRSRCSASPSPCGCSGAPGAPRARRSTS